ncbi:MAG: heparinase II/III domain-containing protein [Anaerolineae bacterium]
MIYFDAGDLRRIRSLRAAHSTFARGWEEFCDRIQGLLAQPFKAVEAELAELRARAAEFGGAKIFRQGNYVRSLSLQTLDLACFHILTGDASARQRAVELVGLICSEKCWTYQGLMNGWDSDLWTADIGRNLALVLDMLAPQPNESWAESLRAALWEKSFLPLYHDWIDLFSHIHALDTMGHNWWGVCVGGAGVVRLVLGDTRPEFAVQREQITSALLEWLNYRGNVLQNKLGSFGPDGDPTESFNYCDYGLSNLCVYETGLRRLSGDERLHQHPHLRGLARYYLGALLQDKDGARLPIFGDAHARRGHPYVALYLASAMQDGRMLSYYLHFHAAPASPLEFLFYPEDLSPTACDNLPLVMVLDNSGLAVLRDGWGAEATQFAMKTGEVWNHNHRDTGTWTLTAGGYEWVVDSGTCTYSHPIYHEYYTTPQAHNVVLWNGRGVSSESLYTGAKFRGCYPTYLEAPGYRYLLADCTGPYADIYSRFYRHLLWLDDRLLFMADDLCAHGEGQFDWLLHFKGQPALEGNTLQLSQDNAHLAIHLLHPQALSHHLEPGYLPEVHDEATGEGYSPPAQYWRASASDPAKRQKFVSVVVLPGADPATVRIERCGDGNMLGARMGLPGITHEVYCNELADGRVMHQNAHARWNEIATDGFLCSISTGPANELQRASLHNGSYLRYRGQLLFSSALKCDLVLDYSAQPYLHAVMSMAARVLLERPHTISLQLVPGVNHVNLS